MLWLKIIYDHYVTFLLTSFTISGYKYLKPSASKMTLVWLFSISGNRSRLFNFSFLSAYTKIGINIEEILYKASSISSSSSSPIIYILYITSKFE